MNARLFLLTVMRMFANTAERRCSVIVSTLAEPETQPVTSGAASCRTPKLPGQTSRVVMAPKVLFVDLIDILVVEIVSHLVGTVVEFLPDKSANRPTYAANAQFATFLSSFAAATKGCVAAPVSAQRCNQGSAAGRCP